ncbi:hypothetical protein FRC02_005519 [Tulasnella sp. 418]|nr:hypothetical protein FRC02_005519 [Tulasnella sp. 418]
MGIGAYISYVDSNIILENVEDGPLSVTEWVLVRMPNSRPRDLFEAHVRPSANAEVMLGITRDILSKLEVKSGDAWTKKLEESTIFNQWSFNEVKETFLNVSDHLH